MGAVLRTVLVDDGMEIRRYLRALLERDGRFEVVGEAGDGLGAIETVERWTPDLVVLDIAMPYMDGISALPEIRRRAPGVRVVVLSGFPRDRMGPRAEEAGAVGYLEKGHRTLSLADELHRLVAVLGAVETLLAERYPADLRAAGQARRQISSRLEDVVDDDVVDTVLLLTSEVVTNAVRHADAGCQVVVERLRDTLRVSVVDEGAGMPAPRVAGDEAESGRGLALVDTLATDWGVDALPNGKRVWFEVGLPAG
jgi:DNA-binding NarL/FixJ family response regulator